MWSFLSAFLWFKGLPAAVPSTDICQGNYTTQSSLPLCIVSCWTQGCELRCVTKLRLVRTNPLPFSRMWSLCLYSHDSRKFFPQCNPCPPWYLLKQCLLKWAKTSSSVIQILILLLFRCTLRIIDWSFPQSHCTVFTVSLHCLTYFGVLPRC